MTGYVNYFSATSLYAAWQAGIKPISPYVEAKLPDGTGSAFPAKPDSPPGLERTIVVDLTGKLPAGTRRIRLMTNLQIYWDQVLIDKATNAQRAPLKFRWPQRRCTSAAIQSRSNAQSRRSRLRLQPRKPDGPFQRERGNYTHLGDVTPLLQWH